MSRAAVMRIVTGLALAAALLAGCGIDQGGVRAPGPSLPGGAAAPRTTIVAGPITGFGSVLVNDLVLDASTAQILIDGEFRTESDLAVGQVIRAVALEDAGRLRALSIEHDENVVGPITAIDMAAGTLTVLGQSIVVGAGTRLGGGIGAVADLGQGDLIAVSGLLLPSGAIEATYVRRAVAGEALQITAAITALDLPSLTLELGGLSIDYSQARLLQLAGGQPALGVVVEARGTAIVDGVLIASEVRERVSLPGLFTASAASLTAFEAPLVGTPTADTSALDVNFLGYITATELPSAIALADLRIAIDAATLIEGGALGDLRVGAKVQVEGRITGFGQIRASRIRVR